MLPIYNSPKRPFKRLLTLLLWLFLTWSTAGFERTAAQDTVTEESPSAMEWLTEQHNDWGQMVGDTGRRLDGFFASEGAITKSNHSFLKLGLQGSYGKGGSSRLDPIMKFRLDLPTLEERLKLVFESEADETRSLEEKNLNRSTKLDSKLSNSAISELRLEAKKTKTFGATTSIGIDLQLPPDYFWRAKAYYRADLSQDWRLDCVEKMYYFHLDGWGETSTFTFERNLGPYVFRVVNEAVYLHQERRMEFAHFYSFQRELSPIRAINYQFGAFGENKPSSRVTSYFINTVYRRKLSHEWLFYEITPELLFPRDEDFDISPSITAKIEMVFSSY